MILSLLWTFLQCIAQWQVLCRVLFHCSDWAKSIDLQLQEQGHEEFCEGVCQVEVAPAWYLAQLVQWQRSPWIHLLPRFFLSSSYSFDFQYLAWKHLHRTCCPERSWVCSMEIYKGHQDMDLDAPCSGWPGKIKILTRVTENGLYPEIFWGVLLYFYSSLYLSAEIVDSLTYFPYFIALGFFISSWLFQIDISPMLPRSPVHQHPSA